MSCHVMSCHVMSCHVMSCCDVMQCDVITDVMWYDAMSCDVMSCHVMSCDLRWCYMSTVCLNTSINMESRQRQYVYVSSRIDFHCSAVSPWLCRTSKYLRGCCCWMVYRTMIYDRIVTKEDFATAIVIQLRRTAHSITKFVPWFCTGYVLLLGYCSYCIT